MKSSISTNTPWSSRSSAGSPTYTRRVVDPVRKPEGGFGLAKQTRLSAKVDICHVQVIGNGRRRVKEQETRRDGGQTR